MDERYDMTFEEAQHFESKRGYDVPWNDGDINIDERSISETVANVVAWADDDMLEKLEDYLCSMMPTSLAVEIAEGFKNFTGYWD